MAIKPLVGQPRLIELFQAVTNRPYISPWMYDVSNQMMDIIKD
jgi:hypothetical protein